MKLRIGELARRSGVTVRTLRHYDQIGLLCPGERTDGDHRLYSEGEVRTLHQIQSLRTLGLSLEQIRGALHGPAHDPAQVLAAQISRLEVDLREGAPWRNPGAVLAAPVFALAQHQAMLARQREQRLQLALDAAALAQRGLELGQVLVGAGSGGGHA